jgi:uracil-DNA glycosylase family 4
MSGAAVKPLNPERRRVLNDAQWLQAMGIDPFWIESPANPVAAASAAAHDARIAAPTEPSTLTATRNVAQIPATDWTALETTIRECRGCSLCKGRKQAVPGSGDRQARWLLVGEAPGADEDAAGLPFVGKAGKLLDAMLAALDLKRDQGVYLTNTVKCRPPENRTPDSAEMDACSSFLSQQIDLLAPEVIVALGKPAAAALLGHADSIQSLRGAVQYREQGGKRIPVVVTYHPAYLLRQPEEKWKSWQDLLLARSVLAGR